MTETAKQEDLLKKQNKATKSGRDANSAVASLGAFVNSQNTEKVTYRDINDKEQTKKITLNDPGIDKVSKAINYINSDNTDDKIELYKLIMNHVIVNPKLSLETESKKFPKSLRTKVITTQINKFHKKVALKNKSGQKVQINLKWPGYYMALQIIYACVNVNGSLNMNEALHLLNDYVFKDDEGKGVRDSYWNAGGHCSGLGLYAISRGMLYLTRALDHDGFNSMIQKGISFLTQSLQ